MKIIELSQNCFTIIDDADYEKASRHSWHVLKFPRSLTRYAATKIRDTEGRFRTVLLHRLLLGLTDKSLQVDHIDGNGLNNTRSNLRITRNPGNIQNRGKLRTNTTGFKGVFWTPSLQKYTVQIQANGKHYTIGRFDDPLIAAKAYDDAAIKLHGQFARGNFI